MQANAAELEQERRARVEKANVEAEEEKKRDAQTRSEKGKFMSGMHRQAEGLDLGETLRRRGGLGVEA